MLNRQQFLGLHQEADKCIRIKLGDRLELNNSRTYLDFLLTPAYTRKLSSVERFVSEEAYTESTGIRIVDGAWTR